ncbi:hypothetical protein, partial [Saccharothrix sp. Mg75]|uniref:hypothetical protein n=1 Tax=Saccharothrix sp. Mg75 TaxID=3445357 RepID=UPI003EF06433
ISTWRSPGSPLPEINENRRYRRMKSWSRAVVTALAAGAVVSGGVFAAQADQTIAADEQQSLVEDFAYPGRDRIEVEDNVKLVSGDGHVIYADCSQPPSGPVQLIEVYSSDLSVGMQEDGRVCFKVTGASGYLTLMLPDVFEIRGDGRAPGAGHKGTAEVIGESGQRKTVELDPDGSAQVGIGVPGGEPSTLLRLEIKP